MRKFWSIINTLTPQKSNANVPDAVKVGKVNFTEPKKLWKILMSIFVVSAKSWLKKFMVLVCPLTPLTDHLLEKINAFINVLTSYFTF